MPNQEFICLNKDCQIHKDKIPFPQQRDCYACHQPLVKKEKVLAPREADIVNNYPYVIAHQYYNFLHEENTSARKELLRDVFEFSLRYLALLILSEYFNSTLKIGEINKSFTDNLMKRSSIGDLEDFIRKAIPALRLSNHTFFIKELPDFYDSSINPDNEQIKKYTIITESNITNKYGEITNTVKELTALQSLREEFRNKRLAHGSYLSEKQNLAILKVYSPILLDFISDMSFLKNYPMLKWEKENCYELTGSGKPNKLNYKEELDKDDPLWIINKKTSERFKLAPFFILPKKHINKVSDDVQLFYYMDFTEDLVRFRSSPNNESGNTSGVLLKKLKYLIEEKKINSVLHTHDTLTESIFTTKVFKYSKTQIAHLGNEDGSLKKMYQSRNDVEVDLKSWLGSKYGLFIISAMAGSGKTFLLANLFKENIYKNFLIDINGVYKPKYEPLILRANRLSTPLIEREIKYALNLHPEFDFNYLSKDLGYSQSEPFVILIDAGNEHNEPNLFIDEILKFIKNYSGGFIKIVLTWRADLKNELPVVSDDYDQYIYAKENDSEQKHLLTKKAYVLRPFNHKELEEVWSKYIEDKDNPLKPKFSWEELNFFDKNLVSELANPLRLKLFLETFNGKSLPESKGYYNFWKEWALRFTDDEYEFLLLLVEVMFEEKVNKLPSVVYYNHPKIKNSLNDINGPFEKLKAKEVLTQYHSNTTRYLTFTVEAFYHFMLGEFLCKKLENKPSEEILELLTNSPIKGIEKGIQNVLIKDIDNKNFSRFTWLIDNSEEDFLRWYALPLGQAFKKYKTKNIFKDLNLFNSNNHIKVLISSLWILQRSLDYSVIQTIYTIILKKLIPSNNQFTILKLNAYNYLLSTGGLIDETFDFTKMVKSFDYNNLDRIDLLKIFNSIALSYEYLRRYKCSIEYYQKCIGIIDKYYNDDKILLGSAYNNISGVYSKQGKYKKALKYLRKNIEHMNPDTADIATLYSNLGLIYTRLNQNKEAITYLNKSLDLYQKHFGPISSNTAISYNLLGTAYYNDGDYQESLHWSNLSLNILLKIHPKYHPEIGSVYYRIGNVYSAMEKWTNAIEHYNSGITVFFHNKKNYSQSLANCYLNLADAYSSCDKSDEALKYYKKSLKIKSLKYNKSNREIFDLQYSIADSYLSLSNYKNALKYLILWWENTDERKGGPAYEAYTCYKELNEPHEAIYWLEKTALLRKEKLGSNDERTQNTINELLEYAKELKNNDIINKWSINNLN